MDNKNVKSYKQAISYEELYKSMCKCKRNVQWKDSTANFVLHSVKQLSLLTNELNNETYQQREPYVFKITSPKPREILSVPFRDRVYQRSINDNILYPTITNSFILDNCACQVGKGNQFARKRLVKQLRRMVNKYGTNLFVLQIDIHGFYKNLKHEYVENNFKNALDEETYRHVKCILSNQYQGEGYNPGSQMVQIAGVSALNQLDHFIKEHLYVECYEHYMDDLVLVFNSEKRTYECKKIIEEELAKIGLEFNKKKTNVYPIQQKAIEFLGFKFFISKTGKIVQLPLPKKIKNAKRKYRHMVNYSLPRGNIQMDSIEESYRNFRTGLEEGNSHYSINRMDKYYLSLWKGNVYEQREIQFIINCRYATKCRKKRKSKSS